MYPSKLFQNLLHIKEIVLCISLFCIAKCNKHEMPNVNLSCKLVLIFRYISDFIFYMLSVFNFLMTNSDRASINL